VLRVRDDLRVEFVRLLEKALRDRVEKRFHGPDDLFPGTVWNGVRRVRNYF
jgi:hypothetical protein